MRTTVKIEDDVSVSIEQLRASDGLGFSEALNRLARAGASVVAAGSERPIFSQPTADLGVMADISNVAEALELADDR